MPKSFLFDTLPDKDKSLLLSKAISAKENKNGFLFREGDEVGAVYYIAEGVVVLLDSTKAGKSKVVAVYHGGEFIWDSMLLGENVHKYSARCITKVSYYSISVAEFEKAFRTKQMNRRLLAILSNQIHDLVEMNDICICNEPEARLAGFLLYHDFRRKGEFIELMLEEIADGVNLRLETVSRKLKNMERSGIIKRMGKGKLQILDYKRLNLLYGKDY